MDLDWSLTILCKYWADSVKILDKCCANIGQILGKYWASIGLIMCKYWENIVQIPLWKSRDLLKLQCSLKDTDTQFLNFHLRDWLTDIPSSGDAYASKKEISVQLVWFLESLCKKCSEVLGKPSKKNREKGVGGYCSVRGPKWLTWQYSFTQH